MIYELNAKPLSHKDVGIKFILHPEFADLTNPKNSLIIGPRGSGKTTMLKMLSPEALEHWFPKNAKEKKIKDSINFIGIYIPMSRIFQDDLEERYRISKLEVAKKINVLHKIYFYNIIESILRLVHFFISKNEKNTTNEIFISEKFNSALELNVEYCYKITSLLSAISLEKLKSRNQLNSNKYVEEKLYTGSIISHIEPILNVINEVFDFHPDQKYALCFDELDVYASEFTADMIKNLRGISTNILLKLTMAPIHNVNINDFLDPPSQIHDFDRIYLWPSPEITGRTRYQEEKRYLNFTEQLATQTFKELIGVEVDLDFLLGKYSHRKVLNLFLKSESVVNNKVNLDDKTDEEIEGLIFLLYAKSDENFTAYLLDQLNQKRLNLKGLSRKDKSENIRKLKPVVFNRLICTINKGEERSFRRQRVLYQYHGKKIMLKCIDGNPRYLKKLVEYLSDFIEYNDNEIRPISISNQARALVKVKDIFLQRINSIALEGKPLKFSTSTLIGDIGKYLSTQINLRATWNSSFPSFIKIPKRKEVDLYESAFRKAVNNGALLVIGDSDLVKLNNIKLKELRLNYLLHVHFKLPIRKFYPTSFENIIRASFKGERREKNLFEND